MTKPKSRWADGSDTTHVSPLPPPLPSDKRLPSDAIIHRQPPPVVVHSKRDQKHAIKKSTQTNKQTRSKSKPATPFQLQVAQHESHVHRESTSWFSSVVIHLLVLAIIALLLVPGDYGGQGMHELIVTFGDGSDPGAGAAFSVDVGEEESIPEPEVVSADGAETATQSSGAKPKQGQADNDTGTDKGGQEGPSGSFFGIETTGHEFVYIVDMSGSMRGDRYRRATEELVRSINDLSEGQKFYVLLFSDRYVQMFHEKSVSPQPIVATPENKRRLADWVDGAFGGGGTDPYEAVRLALRMNPSAIFMLSDGKFKKPNGQNFQRKRSNLFAADTQDDVFTLAQASGKQTPIQSIAFEEPIACENMKRLSVITGGKYRFVGSQDPDQAALVLAEASEALKRGDFDEAENQLNRLIAVYGNTEPAWQGRKKLARMIYENAREAFRSDDIQAVGVAVERLVEIDPKATVTANYQIPLAKLLFDMAQQRPATAQSVAATKAIASLAKRFPKSPLRKTIADPLILKTHEESNQLYRLGLKVESFVVMDRCLQRFPLGMKEGQIFETHQVRRKDLLDQAITLRQTRGDQAYLTYLRDLSTKAKGTSLESDVAPLLAELAISLAKGSQTGTDDRARESRLKVAQEIADQLGDPDLLSAAQRNLTKEETRARTMLRNAQKVEAGGDLSSAMNRYVVIVKTYPNTQSARTARMRFAALRQQAFRDAKDGHSRLQQMLRGANSAKPSR